MVYQRYNKRYNYRRRGRKTYKPKYKYKKQDTFTKYANYAVTALKGVNYIRGLVNSELYKHDVLYNTPITNTGVLVPLTGLAEGNGDDDRTGNSIFVRYVNLDGSVSMQGSNNTIIKMALVMDSQQQADTTPSFTDVYETASINTHLNSNTVGRFSILDSQYLTLNVGQVQTRKVKMNKSMRLHIRYNGATSTDIQRNGLYLALISNQSSNNAPFCEFHIRVSYHDN